MQPSKFGILIFTAGILVAAMPAVIDPRAWPLWTVFGAVMLLLFGVDRALAASPKQISIDIETPELIYIGEPAELSATVRVPGKRRFVAEFLAEIGEPLSPVDPSLHEVPPQGLDLKVPLVARRRGTAKIATLWIRYRGPLGLVELTHRVPIDREISIVPNIMPTRRTALRCFNERSFMAGLKVERYRGAGSDFDSLREFVKGDDQRMINWRATARHRTILCRETRAERNHQVVLAVDTGYLMCEPLGNGIPKLDHAIASALLLSYVGLKTGDRVGLFTFDERVRIYAKPEGGTRHFHTLSKLTSSIEYTQSETNFTLGLTTLSQNLRRRSLIVVLTDFVDTITAELMLENLERINKKHVVLFVSLQDPHLVTLAQSEPSGILGLNRAVVSSNYLNERRGVLKRLQRLGVMTIDADASSVGPEMINTYLHVKRRELI
jgi:uncharacterized protein (DUF58 family)